MVNCVCVCVFVFVLSPGHVDVQRAGIVGLSEECGILLIGAPDSGHTASV